MGRLESKAVIITGAGSGMGAAMAARFVMEGARVVAVSRTRAKLDRLVATIPGAAEQLLPVELDVAAADAADVIVDAALERFGKIDVVVNNAGIGDGFQLAGEVSDEVWRRTMEVNLEGPMRLCRRVIPVFVEQGHGVFIATSSVADRLGGRSGAAYTASKHALTGLMRSIAATYAERGIRANTISPGWTATEMTAGAELSRDGYRQFKDLAALVPRVAQPDEVAALALFLASDESSMLNGSVVVADTGWSVR